MSFLKQEIYNKEWVGQQKLEEVRNRFSSKASREIGAWLISYF